MMRMQRHISREPIACLAALLAVLVGLAKSFAQEPSSTFLQQLSSDTQQLYAKVHPGVVRVQLPTPQWLEQVNEQEKFLHKWGSQLKPDVLQQLRQEQEKARTEEYRLVGAVAATQPADSPTTQAVAVAPIQQPPSELSTPNPNRTGHLVLVATGLLIDGEGHVVVPLFVDRQAIGNLPLKVLMGDGKLTLGHYVGSDRLTNLTVIQLDNHNGHAAPLSAGRPDDGSLALVITSDGGARLTVWTNQHPDPGLIVTPDGLVAGFSFNGGLLTAAACKPIINQIIATGEVHRAVLGAWIREIRKDDVLRQSTPALGVKPAIRVENIEAGSAAQRGGLQAGDLILAIGGQPVGEKETFAAVIATRSGKTDLQILRDSEVLTLSIDLQPQ